jgi:hypothetical protein
MVLRSSYPGVHVDLLALGFLELYAGYPQGQTALSRRQLLDYVPFDSMRHHGIEIGVRHAARYDTWRRERGGYS